MPARLSHHTPSHLPSRPHHVSKRPRLSLFPHSYKTLKTLNASTRSFSATAASHLDDHYATLDLPPTAPAPEVKKQFYKLSKAHHPDHNPSDPEGASKKFVAISEAYATLGDPAKREKYDRDLERARGPAGGGRGGSYSSPGGGGSYAAGARRASGLSKRRAHFRGPPPSFYRSGGWGDASAKREANFGRDAREAEARRQRQRQQQNAEGGEGAKDGGYAGATGSWPFSTDPNDVAHFDREGHYKTQSSVEEQLRRGRRKRRGVVEQPVAALDEGGSVFGNFILVCGMLTFGLGVPLMFYSSKGK